MPKIMKKKAVLTLDDTDISTVISALQLQENRLISEINLKCRYKTDDDLNVDLFLTQRLIDMFNALNNSNNDNMRFL